jgi:hypothetical protein
VQCADARLFEGLNASLAGSVVNRIFIFRTPFFPNQLKNNMDVVLEAFLEFVMIYPGAFVRWVLFRKRSFKGYLNDSVSYNVVAFAAISIFIFLILLVINVIL